MITIDAYRSAIGSFYSTAVKQSCHYRSKYYAPTDNDQQSQYEDGMFFKSSNNSMCYFLKTLFIATMLVTLTCNVSTASLKLMMLLSGDVETNPGPVFNNIDFQVALNESYATSLLSNHTTANQVVTNAHAIGLSNLTYDEPTIGDGNCFYHAIVQQLRRPEIRLFVDPELHFQHHHDLRLAVVNFIRQNIVSDLFKNYRQFYTTSVRHGTMTWEQLLQNQERSTVFVEELFIRATAIMLNVNILVTSENNTQDRPYTLISCLPDESHNVSGERQVTQMLTDGNDTGVLIGLGSINSDHFQSLIVNDTDQHTTPVNEPSSSCSVLKSPCKNTTSTTSNTIPSVNKQTNQFYVAKETVIKNKCVLSYVFYEAPKPNETTSDTQLRRRRLSRACNKNAKACPKITNPAILSPCSSPPKKIPCLSPQSAKMNVTVDSLDDTSTQNVPQQNMLVQNIMASINLGGLYKTKKKT